MKPTNQTLNLPNLDVLFGKPLLMCVVKHTKSVIKLTKELVLIRSETMKAIHLAKPPRPPQLPQVSTRPPQLTLIPISDFNLCHSDYDDLVTLKHLCIRKLKVLPPNYVGKIKLHENLVWYNGVQLPNISRNNLLNYIREMLVSLDTTTKVCTTCNRTLSLSYFDYQYVDEKKIVRWSLCHECRRGVASRSYRKNRDKLKNSPKDIVDAIYGDITLTPNVILKN